MTDPSREVDRHPSDVFPPRGGRQTPEGSVEGEDRRGVENDPTDSEPSRADEGVIKTTLVGIGIIRRPSDGRFLIRERPPGTVYAGYWEFPGGKVEPGEAPAETTERECLEETGLAVRAHSLRAQIEHTYPHGRVRLHFFDCTPADPSAQPDSACRWVLASELPSYRFPEANEPVLAQLVAEASAGLS